MIANEDLMDLGPFLQHYVLRNPFSQSMYQSQNHHLTSCRNNIPRLNSSGKRLCLMSSENKNGFFNNLENDAQSLKKSQRNASDSELVMTPNPKQDLLDLSVCCQVGKSDTTRNSNDSHISASSVLNVIKIEPIRLECFNSEKNAMDDELIEIKEEQEGTNDENKSITVNDESMNEPSKVVNFSRDENPREGAPKINSKLRKTSYLGSRISILNARNAKLRNRMRKQNIEFNYLLEEFTNLQNHFNHISALFRRYSESRHV